MRSEVIFFIEEAPEGGYTAEALGHGIVTEGDTFDEVRQMVRDAVRVHFEDDEHPALIRLHFVRDEAVLA